MNNYQMERWYYAFRRILISYRPFEKDCGNH